MAICGSKHKFRATHDANHPLNGKEFTCETELKEDINGDPVPHEGNHTAHTGRKGQDRGSGEDLAEVVHWQ